MRCIGPPSNPPDIGKEETKAPQKEYIGNMPKPPIAPSHSLIDPATLRAYRETEYRVHSDRPFTLIVDRVSPELAATQRDHHVDCSTFLTACNPFSQPVSTADNRHRQQALSNELADRGFDYIEGIGRGPDGDWPGELSFLALGPALETAMVLGMRYAQNALVWSGASGKPRLILLR